MSRPGGPCGLSAGFYKAVVGHRKIENAPTGPVCGAWASFSAGFPKIRGVPRNFGFSEK